MVVGAAFLINRKGRAMIRLLELSHFAVGWTWNDIVVGVNVVIIEMRGGWWRLLELSL